MAGRTSKLVILESRCVDCGAPFRFMTTFGALRRREVNRRCARHKRPGVRVEATNVGPDKDSEGRQREAIEEYAVSREVMSRLD
jgi:hypothetical protein